ncbi:MAG: hypothetical protein M3498_13150 [Deinococcota bacterium]|nr:hypothetical protein [Deinococcota bacterium]
MKQVRRQAWITWFHIVHSWYLPNIKLHARGDRDKKGKAGYGLMREFAEKRMDLELITKDALETIITYGGGVFRQTCVLMQTAADHAEDKDKAKISMEEARAAIAEVSNGLQSQLTTEDLKTLKRVAEDNGTQLAFEAAKLLHNLSLLRYPNDHHWHDVNPVLWELVDGYGP